MKTMKMRTISLFVALMLTVGAMAQEFHYGVNAGTNLAVQSEIADYYHNDQIRAGLHAGLTGRLAWENGFELQTELNYEQKGSKSDDYTSKYDYIKLPVLAKYSLGQSDHTPLRFNINAGPYVSYLVNAELEMNDDLGGATVDRKDNSNEFEFGTILGFGLAYPVNSGNITFDVRLGLGLTDFDKNDDGSNNKYVGFSLGYEF